MEAFQPPFPLQQKDNCTIHQLYIKLVIISKKVWQEGTQGTKYNFTINPRSPFNHTKIKKTTSVEHQKKKRADEREIKKTLESDLDGQDNIVLQNRISCRTYDKIRKSTSLSKRKLEDGTTPQPKKRRHGNILG